MDNFILIFTFIMQIILTQSLIVIDKKSVIWDRDGFYGHSLMWIKMTTFKQRKILKYLFYEEKLLDYKTLRVPVWSLIFKSNIYLNIISLIIGFVLSIISLIVGFDFLKAITYGLQSICIMFTLASGVVCLLIVPFIEYIIWKFFIHEDKYIENFIILKVILLYILFQICSIFIMKFFFLS